MSISTAEELHRRGRTATHGKMRDSEAQRERENRVRRRDIQPRERERDRPRYKERNREVIPTGGQREVPVRLAEKLDVV